MNFPRVIHQFWMSDSGRDLPADIAVNVSAWKETHPTFVRHTWRFEEFEGLLSDFHGLNVLECVRASRFTAMKSDIIRLALVYEFGGVWSDLKNRPLVPFLESRVEVGIPFIAEHPPSTARPHPVDYLCNQLFGAPIGSDLIFDVLTEVCDNVTSRTTGSVYGVSGGAVLLKVVNRAIERGEPYSFETLRYGDTWGKVVKRTAASYNDGGQHWSERQKTEGLYVGDGV